MKDNNEKYFLRSYQEEVIEIIQEFQKSKLNKAKIYMAPGTGKTTIIIEYLKRLFDKNSIGKVLLLSSYRVICEQFKEKINAAHFSIDIASNIREFKNQDILITTYHEVIAHQNEIDFECFDLIICEEAQFISMEQQFSKKIKVLGFFSGTEVEKGFFDDAECLFSYTFADSIEDGYINTVREIDFIRFFTEILKNHGYKNLLLEPKLDKKMRPDLTAEKNKVQYIFEIKIYRSMDVSQRLIENAINQMIAYKSALSEKNQKIRFVLVLLCNIFDDFQKKTYEQSGIEIWDIGNLIYLCNIKQNLSESLMVMTPYSLSEIKEKELMEVSDMKFVKKDNNINEKLSILAKYQTNLKNCSRGKQNGADKEYEKICTEIIKYLFETDFLKMSEQHKTEDEVFRMDLLCSLKESNEFWKFLINFYKTKFIVFEYKNYGNYIKQNLIYTTEKYLFPAALRNVAIIISRNGFDENAHRAALGYLKESGKLIIDLKDDDLLKMIAMKENGEEPSDYLLDQVEEFLMAISK